MEERRERAKITNLEEAKKIVESGRRAFQSAFCDLEGGMRDAQVQSSVISVPEAAVGTLGPQAVGRKGSISSER